MDEQAHGITFQTQTTLRRSVFNNGALLDMQFSFVWIAGTSEIQTRMTISAPDALAGIKGKSGWVEANLFGNLAVLIKQMGEYLDLLAESDGEDTFVQGQTGSAKVRLLRKRRLMKAPQYETIIEVGDFKMERPLDASLAQELANLQTAVDQEREKVKFRIHAHTNKQRG